MALSSTHSGQRPTRCAVEASLARVSPAFGCCETQLSTALTLRHGAGPRAAPQLPLLRRGASAPQVRGAGGAVAEGGWREPLARLARAQLREPPGPACACPQRASDWRLRCCGIRRVSLRSPSRMVPAPHPATPSHAITPQRPAAASAQLHQQEQRCRQGLLQQERLQRDARARAAAAVSAGGGRAGSKQAAASPPHAQPPAEGGTARNTRARAAAEAPARR
jgi:hypothetical protein